MDANLDINFGEYLRAKRLEKGLSIEMVWKQTRITPAYLEAIEAGNWLKLPEKLYVQAYLRAYAACVGLQSEDVLRRFALAAGTFYDAKADLTKVADQLRQKQHPHSGLTRIVDRVGAFLRPRPATNATAPTHLAIN